MHDEAPQYVLDALRLLHDKSLYKIYVEASRYVRDNNQSMWLPTSPVSALTRSIYRVAVLERKPK